MITSADIIGISGVSIILIAYFLLQFEMLKSKSLEYSLMNFIGACLILYSLMFNWNLASVIIEIFWILISVYGIYRYYRYKHLKVL